jgi:hypothetical protein
VWQKKIVHGDGIKKISAHNDPRKKFPASSKPPPPPPPSKVKWSAPKHFYSPYSNEILDIKALEYKEYFTHIDLWRTLKISQDIWPLMELKIQNIWPSDE